MKQKINLRLVIVAILSAAMTMTGIVVICYSLFKTQVLRDLQTTATVLAKGDISKIVDSDISQVTLRITWIDADGSVIYDNDVSADTMTNHLDRPEVIDAFNQGKGESVRKSDTVNMKTFYYAILLDDGTVLRVATEAGSMSSVFIHAAPLMLLIIILIIIICVSIGHLLTIQLLTPIKEMAENIDEIPSYAVYKELTPFIDRIREQHDNILSAAKTRQDFTANVSHELKTPLTAISGYAELIENDMVDATKQKKFASDIRANADRLVALINDIIRMSELDHSEIDINFTQQNLYEIAVERVELLQNNASKKNVTLTLAGKDTYVLSNRGMLIELLDNLIQNAIRYNVPGGKVEVQVFNEGEGPMLLVKDTGIGIPEGERDRIFERFYRVDKSRSRETGGTGLGLSIVKHIVELHDGEIVLSSTVNKGTSVLIKL